MVVSNQFDLWKFFTVVIKTFKESKLYYEEGRFPYHAATTTTLCIILFVALLLFSFLAW